MTAFKRLRDLLCGRRVEIAVLRRVLEIKNERLAEARREVEICHARETCCCGSYVKEHTVGSGHSPVSMYDYALDRAEARVKELEDMLEQKRTKPSV